MYSGCIGIPTVNFPNPNPSVSNVRSKPRIMALLTLSSSKGAALVFMTKYTGTPGGIHQISNLLEKSGSFSSLRPSSESRLLRGSVFINTRSVL